MSGKVHFVVMSLGFATLLFLSQFVGVNAFLLFIFFGFSMITFMMLGKCRIGQGNGEEDHAH